MAVQPKVIELPPPCMVKGCNRFRQLKNFRPEGKKPYLQTCRRHTYKDIKAK